MSVVKLMDIDPKHCHSELGPPNFNHLIIKLTVDPILRSSLQVIHTHKYTTKNIMTHSLVTASEEPYKHMKLSNLTLKFPISKSKRCSRGPHRTTTVLGVALQEIKKNFTSDTSNWPARSPAGKAIRQSEPTMNSCCRFSCVCAANTEELDL